MADKTPDFLGASYANWGTGIAIGLGAGIALGAALDDIGIALGAAFAVVFALMMGDIRRRRAEDEADGPPGEIR